MRKSKEVIEINNVIEIIKSGRVVVRNVHNAQVYDIYKTDETKPTVSFVNGWGKGEFSLTVRGRVVVGLSYANMPDYKLMDEYRNFVRLLDACLRRCREQSQFDLFDNVANVNGNPNAVADYRKNIFAKVMGKFSKVK